MGDEDLRVLCDSDPEALTHLDLSGCRRIGDRGAEVLGTLKGLKHLQVGGTGISVVALKALRRALPALVVF